MSEILSLPALDDELSRLKPGDTLRLGTADFIRLFGVNSAALGRLRHFAKGHNCVTTRAKAGLQFKKLPPQIAAFLRKA